MVQHPFNAVAIGIAQKQAARSLPYFAEALATLPHGRRVHQGKHLFDIAHHKRIKQRLVRVLQVAENAVFMEGIRLAPQCLKPALDLFIQTPHMRRQ